MLCVNGVRYRISHKAKKRLGMGVSIQRFKKRGKCIYPRWLQNKNAKFALLNIGIDYELRKSMNRPSDAVEKEIDMLLKHVQQDIKRYGYEEASDMILEHNDIPIKVLLEFYGYGKLRSNGSEQELAESICFDYHRRPGRYDPWTFVDFFANEFHMMVSYWQSSLQHGINDYAHVRFIGEQMPSDAFNGAVAQRAYENDINMVLLFLMARGTRIPRHDDDVIMPVETNAVKLWNSWPTYHKVASVLINSNNEYANDMYRRYLLSRDMHHPYSVIPSIFDSWLQARKVLGVSKWTHKNHQYFIDPVKTIIELFLLCLQRTESNYPGICDIRYNIIDYITRRQVISSYTSELEYVI